MCPGCKTQVKIAHAQRAHDEGRGPVYPAAASLDRAPPAKQAPVEEYDLPTPEQIHGSARFVHSDDPLLVRGARLATAGVAAVILFFLLNNLVVLIVGAPGAAAYAVASRDVLVQVLVITPTPVSVLDLSGPAAAAWYLGTVITIALCCFLFLRAHLVGALRRFGEALMGPGSPRLSDDNGFFLMARLFSVTALATIVVSIVADVAGSQPAVPPSIAQPVLEPSLIALAQASVWEEVVARVLLLGVPLLAVVWAGRGKLDRPAWSYLTGGKVPLDGPALVFLTFSSVAFGLAHAPGWDLWKVPSSTVAGFAFGVLFLRAGLPAAIVLHFVIDYVDLVSLMGATLGYLQLLGIMWWAVAMVGVPNAIRYLFVAREVLDYGGVPPHLGGPERPPRPEPPAAPPTAQP